jgi:hypothetical protein
VVYHTTLLVFLFCMSLVCCVWSTTVGATQKYLLQLMETCCCPYAHGRRMSNVLVLCVQEGDACDGAGLPAAPPTMADVIRLHSATLPPYNYTFRPKSSQHHISNRNYTRNDHHQSSSLQCPPAGHILIPCGWKHRNRTITHRTGSVSRGGANKT